MEKQKRKIKHRKQEKKKTQTKKTNDKENPGGSQVDKKETQKRVKLNNLHF